MCGRFTLTIEDRDLLAALLGVSPEDIDDSWQPRWNVAPMQEHWIVRPAATREDRALVRATWGLVNAWDPNRTGAARQINARAESLEERSAYRAAFRATRCIVPADGFYEWTGEREARRPFWFHRPDDGLVLFAGLYTEAQLPGELRPTTTFTIITTPASGAVSHIHDRMPAILDGDEAADEWLAAGQPAERLRALLRPAPPDTLVARAVSRRVNAVAADDPACLVEAEADTQGALF
ncbi:MAG: SOS response-associated peptidase [Chloroflexi bacterium]|nr:SOS response-associated peptidase [Chloroflexota bacterium]MDA1146445.1 SOS response-associated peptidase [Chloroflexota bacterium]MQC82314.1 SOS response-associated peptidase [Chloroflexota bacterium]MQC82626.1 SOS response-associated peptidase [Chloroflexota bacterium]